MTRYGLPLPVHYLLRNILMNSLQHDLKDCISVMSFQNIILSWLVLQDAVDSSVYISRSFFY